MFGIGMPELLLILAVALMVLGPKKLPELARSLGRGLAELKKSTNELKQNIDLGDDLKQVQEDFQEVKSGLQDLADTASLNDVTPDYLKETPSPREPIMEGPLQEAAPPVEKAGADPIRDPFPPLPVPDLHGTTDDIREELAEVADRTYREYHPEYPSGGDA